MIHYLICKSRENIFSCWKWNFNERSRLVDLSVDPYVLHLNVDGTWKLSAKQHFNSERWIISALKKAQPNLKEIKQDVYHREIIRLFTDKN